MTHWSVSHPLPHKAMKEHPTGEVPELGLDGKVGVELFLQRFLRALVLGYWRQKVLRDQINVVNVLYYKLTFKKYQKALRSPLVKKFARNHFTWLCPYLFNDNSLVIIDIKNGLHTRKRSFKMKIAGREDLSVPGWQKNLLGGSRGKVKVLNSRSTF